MTTENEFDLFYRDQYLVMHESARENFAGFQTIFCKNYLEKIFNRFNIKTVLDYGCGKGFQYLFDKIHKAWNLDSVCLYDIGVLEFSIKPEKNKKFDAVLCLDVMEHIREDHLDYYLRDIFSYAKDLVVFSISCRPAKKSLPNGENAHLTVKPVEWWNEKISSVMSQEKIKQKTIILYEAESNKDFKHVKQYHVNLSREDVEFIKNMTD